MSSERGFGHCGTAPLGGECATDSKGSWSLNLTTSWAAALDQCNALCLGCARCSVISYSVKHRDCSWFSHCDLQRLRTDVSGFRTLRLRADQPGERTEAGPSFLNQPCQPDALAANASQHKRPVIALHLSHGAGTFLTNQARANCERVTSSVWFMTGGNLKGDRPNWPAQHRSCSERRAVAADQDLTFMGFERGFMKGEFCPRDFGYVLLLRRPAERMRSMATSSAMPIDQLLAALARGQMDVSPFYNFLKPPKPSTRRYGLVNFDNALVRFLVEDAMYLPLGAVNATHLAEARRTLSRFCMVMTLDLISGAPGLAERVLQRSVMGWHRLYPVARNVHNNYSDGGTTARMSEQQLAALVARNALDMQLWDEIRHDEERLSPRALLQRAEQRSQRCVEDQKRF